MEINTGRKYERFAVGLDYDGAFPLEYQHYVSFLYVPDVDQHDHFHIDISIPTVKKLVEYLQKQITEIESKE